MSAPRLLQNAPGDLLATWQNEPRLMAVVRKLPGWAELEDAVARFEEQRGVHVPRGDIAEAARASLAASRFVGGSTLEEVNEQIRIEEDAARWSHRTSQIADGLTRELDSRARSILNEHTESIADGLGEQLSKVVGRATEIAARMPDVHTSKDLAQHPGQAEAYAQFAALVGEFNQIRSAIATFAKPQIRQASASDMYQGLNGGQPWDLSDLFANYEAAWPEFYLLRGLALNDTRGNYYGTLPPAEAPWANLDPEGLLRYIADRALEVWCPTASQREDQDRRIAKRATELLTERLQHEVRIGRAQRQPTSQYVSQPSPYRPTAPQWFEVSA